MLPLRKEDGQVDESQVFNRFRIDFQSNRRTSTFSSVSTANPKLSNGSIPSNPNQQQSASSKAKKVSPVDRYSVSKQGGEAVSKDQLRI